MDISLLNIMRTVHWDFRHDMARNYAYALNHAIEIHVDSKAKEKLQGYYLSLKGTKTKQGNFQDSLYVGNIHRIENHLKWNDEELADDDQIIDVVVVNGPVTRDGGACSYGTKDFRNQVMYANTIPQVVGHIFVINTPGGESDCRKDYEMMINDCREKGKPTVAFVDGMCCSSGMNLVCRCDRTVVMGPKDSVGCIGTMAAFWATPDGATDINGSRYVEIVGDSCPEKNDWYREAAKGEYDKLKQSVNEGTEEFHNTVRENRPLVEDWMLKGDVYTAQKVIPQLVDEIGNMDRAIQCVFDLAEGKLAPARTAVKADGTDTAEPKPEAPASERKDEMGQLNDQQKAAMSVRPGSTKIVENGHVREVVETPFGPVEQEIAKPQNHKEMTDEEKKKAQESANAEGKKDEQASKKPAEEPCKSETNEGDPNEGGEPDNNGNPDEGSSSSDEGSSSSATPDEGSSSSDEGSSSSDEDSASSTAPDEGSSSSTTPDEGSSSSAEPKAPGDPSTVGEDAKKLSKMSDELKSAKAIIADRNKSLAEKDKTIAKRDKAIAEKDKSIAEKDAAIAERDKSIKEMGVTIKQLTKKVDELTAEVKELAAKPEPVGDEGGVPQSNGTGAQPKQTKKYFKRGMSYEEIRAARKQMEADRKAKKEAEQKANRK
ncbi:MAG: S49 family peptidase [Prevotella sp.]